MGVVITISRQIRFVLGKITAILWLVWIKATNGCLNTAVKMTTIKIVGQIKKSPATGQIIKGKVVVMGQELTSDGRASI